MVSRDTQDTYIIDSISILYFSQFIKSIMFENATSGYVFIHITWDTTPLLPCTTYIPRRFSLDLMQSIINTWELKKKNHKNTKKAILPPQLKIFLTAVVVNISLLRSMSANCPPTGTTIVMSKCGSAPRRPD